MHVPSTVVQTKMVDVESTELKSERRPSFGVVQRIEGIGGPVIPHSATRGSPINFLLVVTCIAFGCSSFLTGMDDKIISPIVALEPFVRKFQGPNPSTGKFVFTARNQDLLFSVPLVGSILGALTAPILNSHLGRKWPLLGAYTCSIGGVFLQLFAQNIAAFVSGRFINAVVFGVASATAPLYLAEVVPISMRGRAVSSMNILSLTAGVVATVVVFATHNIDGPLSFKIPLAVQCVMPVILIPLTAFLPESPQWLVGKNRIQEARNNLRKLRGWSDAQVDDELRVMIMCEENERALTAEVKFWHLFNQENLKRTITAGSLFSLNQISGIILSTTYVTIFLTELGVGSPFTLTVIASCCVLAGCIAAPFTIDRAGRRPTALVGMTILFITDIIAGGLAFDASNRNSALGIASLSFMFNFFWAASFYSLSSLLPAEIATPKLRNYTMSYTIAWAQTTAVITTFAVPQLTAADAANLGAKAYLVFGGCMACIILFVYFYLPETRGRSFAEIDEMYDKKIPMRKWRKFETSTEAKQAKVVSDTVLASL